MKRQRLRPSSSGVHCVNDQQHLLMLFNRAGVQGLPKYPRTLLCTPCSVNINPSYFGVEYHWFGIDDQLTRALDFFCSPTSSS